MNPQVPTETRQRITEPLDEISRKTGQSSYVVFSDFLDLMILSFTGNEFQYLNRVQSYSADGHDLNAVREILKLHAEALSGLVIGVDETTEDVLGAVYEHHSTFSSKFSQHFTPSSVSKVSAEVVLPADEDIDDASADDPLLIGDITGCGSGGLLLDIARQFRIVEADKPAIYAGWDIDADCVKMCVINFVLHHIRGFVLQGDALRVEINRCWQIEPTRMLYGKPPVEEMSSSQKRKIKSRLGLSS